MILKINKLKRFGIYQNYTWGAIDDFKKKNLIYGWNYSGKTTISKLFQVLEFKDKNRFVVIFFYLAKRNCQKDNV